MSAPLLLGIDVGTTSCKAAVVDLEGRELAHGRTPTPWVPVPTGAELDADAVMRAVAAAASEALASAPDGPVAAVAVASMAETGALLDADGRAIHPMIAWHDGRGAEEAERFANEVGADLFSTRTGLRCSATPSLFKIRWLHEHRPETRRAARWLNLAELVVHRLGAEPRAEPSLGSRNGWLDQPRGGRWREALDWAGMDEAVLAEPARAGESVGRVSPGRLGRADGAVLTIAGHDHLVAAVGAGVIGDDEIVDSCGTAEALVRSIAGPLTGPETLAIVRSRLTVGVHVVPARQALLAGFPGGMVLDRFLALLGSPALDRAALDRAAIEAPAGARGLRVTDGAGEAAALTGIPRDPTAGLVWRAAIESIQAETAIRLAAMRAIGVPPRRLVVTGGWAHEPAVRAIKREVLGPFELAAVTEAGCRGAALLAGVAAGLFEDARHLPPLATA